MRDQFALERRGEFPSQRPIEPEHSFLLRIAQECRRAERSRNKFVLVLVQGFQNLAIDDAKPILASIAEMSRDIDTIGWYQSGVTVGVLFAELGDAPAESAWPRILDRLSGTIREFPGSGCLQASACILPRDLKDGGDLGATRVDRYLAPLSSPDVKLQIAIKRIIDVVGSASLLLLLAPIFLAVTIAVKLSSSGPVLFRQKRVGQHGKRFTFLKFRSMEVVNDSSVHEKYVKDFIHGQARRHTNEKGEGVFKLTQDPRVTKVGKFIRKTSLDELPQLWNVLMGEMSLVGPRPPIPYEVDCYDLWHQRRVLEMKPGITGLWQVSGRSRVGFDDMVRLDLQYARTWSLALDFKILLKTPLAVIGDGGAH